MPKPTVPHVIRLADGTHHREPPPGHPNQDHWCSGQLAARKYAGKDAAERAIEQLKLRGATAVPCWYDL